MASTLRRSWIVFEPVAHDYESQYHEDYMGKVKEYTVADLFYTDWKELNDKTHAAVFALYQRMCQSPIHPSHPSLSPLEGENNTVEPSEKEKVEYGVLLIS